MVSSRSYDAVFRRPFSPVYKGCFAILSPSSRSPTWTPDLRHYRDLRRIFAPMPDCFSLFGNSISSTLLLPIMAFRPRGWSFLGSFRAEHRARQKKVCIRYFALRRAWEAGGRVEAADVVFLNAAKNQFRSEGVEALYQKWCQGITEEADFARLSSGLKSEIRGTISTLVGVASRYRFSIARTKKRDVTKRWGGGFTLPFTPGFTSMKPKATNHARI